MTTALGIITSAMKKIKVLTKTDALSSDESADGLTALNALLSSWSNDSLVCYARVTETFSLSPSVASYSIGTGQTFNTARPLFIASAYTTSGSIDYPLEAMSDEDYNEIQVKTIGASPPEYINYTTSYPFGRIRLYPVPTVTSTITLTSEKEISSLALTDTISFPPGWERALIYNLAMEIAPEYSAQPDPFVMQSAKEALGNIRLNVSRNRPIMFGPDANSMQNIYTGYVP